MHELSLCESLVEAILNELEKIDSPSARVIKSTVIIGAMRQIVPEFFKDAYQILTKDTPAAGSELIMELKPTVLQCKKCSWEGEIEDVLFQCQECESFEIEVVSGMELCLQSMEIEDL